MTVIGGGMPIRIENTDLVYFPVPKIACTSVKTAILEHNDPERLARLAESTVNGRQMHVHDVYPSRRMRVTDRLVFARGRWTALVRDPVRRFVSGYRNRIVHHRDLDNAPVDALVARGLSPDPTLEEFARRLGDYVAASRAVRHHFAPICAYLGDRPQSFARIFALEEVEDFLAFVREAGAHLALPHEQTGGPRLSVDDLTSATRRDVEVFYDQDYRVWGTHFR